MWKNVFSAGTVFQINCPRLDQNTVELGNKSTFRPFAHKYKFERAKHISYFLVLLVLAFTYEWIVGYKRFLTIRTSSEMSRLPIVNNPLGRNISNTTKSIPSNFQTLKSGWKNEAQPNFFNQLGENQSKSSPNSMLSKITYSNLLRGRDFLCFLIMIY